VDFAVLWGFLALVLGFIPNVGLIIATFPAIIIALILYGPGTALANLIIGTALNAAMDNAVAKTIVLTWRKRGSTVMAETIMYYFPLFLSSKLRSNGLSLFCPGSSARRKAKCELVPLVPNMFALIECISANAL
jgi:hypothetical protein